MPETDIFGLPTTPPEETEEFNWLSETDPAVTPPAAQEAVAGSESPAEAPEQAPPAPDTEAQVSEAPEAAETPEEEAYRWAGKYESPQDLEQGYRELRDLWRRTSEDAKAREQQNMELLAKARELETALQQAIPYVQEAVRLRERPQLDEFGQPVPQAAPSPQQIQSYIQQQVAAATSQREAALRAELERQREVEEARSNVLTFYERHPEVEQDGRLDNDIAETILALNDAWARTGSTVAIDNQESLDLAYEAAKDPYLRQVLELKPEYFDTDAGMELARMEAQVLRGNAITKTSSAVPASQVGATAGQRKPVIERASGGGTDAGSVDPTGDIWLEAVAAYRGDTREKKSVFFE